MPGWIYVVGAILLFLALLLSMKVNIVVSYKNELRVFLRILFVRIRLYPKKVKLKEKKKKKKIKSEKQPTKEVTVKEEKTVSPVKAILEIKDLILSLASKALGGLHFKFARLNIVVACEDATKTALLYGATVQSVAYLLEALDTVSNVEISRFSDININSNFISQKSSIEGKITLYIRVFSGVKLLISLLKTYFIYKSKKQSLSEDENGKDNSK